MKSHKMAAVPLEEDLCHNVPYYTEQCNSGRHPTQCHSIDQGFLRDFLRSKVVEKPGEGNKMVHSIQSAELRRQNKDPGRYEIDSVQSKRCARSVKEHITKEADIWIGDQVGVNKPDGLPAKVAFYSKRRAALERAQVSTYDPYVTEYMASFASSTRRGGSSRDGEGKLKVMEDEEGKKIKKKKKTDKKKHERIEVPERSSKETQERSSKSTQKVVPEKDHHHHSDQQKRRSSWHDDLDETRRSSKDQATNKEQVKQAKQKTSSSSRESPPASCEEEEYIEE